MSYNVPMRVQLKGRCCKIIAIMTSREMMLTACLLALSTFAGASSPLESEINHLNSIENLKPSVNTAAAVNYEKAKPRQFPFHTFGMPASLPPASLGGCPLCDSSVYSYCSRKLIHDSCCCDFPGAAIYQKPPHCAFKSCTILYAKSCYEHSLIKNCCCNNPY